MSECGSLIKLEMLSLYGINKCRHTKDKKSKNRARLLMAAIGLVILIVCAYIVGLVYALTFLGVSAAVPAYLVTISGMLVFVFGIFRGGHRMFSPRSSDILFALPIKTSSLVISRFLVMYAEDLLLTLLIMLPGCTAFAVLQAPAAAFYLMAPIVTLLIPAIPLVLSTVLGTIIMAISARMRRKSLVQTALTVLLFLCLSLFLLLLQRIPSRISSGMLADLAKNIGALLERIYPPALWCSSAMAGTHLMRFSLYGLLCILSSFVYVTGAARLFVPLVQRLSAVSAKHDYTVGKMSDRSLMTALYIREMRRYFSSSIYVTNTILGPVLTCIASIALCVVGIDGIASAMPFSILPLIPFALTAIMTMMTTTSCAVSMEGRQIDQIKSLPIPVKALFDSKLLCSLTLLGPAYVVSQICLIIALSPDILSLTWMLLTSALLLLFAAAFGLFINIKLHSFDWEKEEQVVKQSASSLLGGLSGPLLSLLLGGISVAIPAAFRHMFSALICFLLAVATLWLYRKSSKTQLDTL